MVRIIKRISLGTESVSNVPYAIQYVEGFCNTADVSSNLPTSGIAHGSKITDVETGTVYMYDENDGDWNEQATAGGGGYDVIIQSEGVIAPGQNYSFQKGSFEEIRAKLSSGNPQPVNGVLTIRGNEVDDWDTAASCVFTNFILGDYGNEIYAYFIKPTYDSIEVLLITEQGIIYEE